MTAEEFYQLRDASWCVNAPVWQKKLSNDLPRLRVFEEVARTVSALNSTGAPLRQIVDVGCGDGTLLMMLAQSGIKAELVGLDKCRTFTHSTSSNRTVNFVYGDIESGVGIQSLLPDLVVSTFSLIEMPHLLQALRNVRSMLKRGGSAIFSILDDEIEYERYGAKVDSELSGAMFDVEGETVIQSLFRVEDRVSPAPYFRILRSKGEYLKKMAWAGLRPVAVTPVQLPEHLARDAPASILITTQAEG